MRFIKSFSEVFFHEWGFNGAKDYFCTVFGFKGANATICVQAILGVVFAMVTFVEDWIWNPPIAYFLLLFVIIMDAWYGYQVAVKIKDEKFDARKGYRTASIMIAHTLQLFFFYNIGTRVYPATIYLAHGVFIYLIAYKAKSWLTHLAMLKFQEKGMVKFLLDLVVSRYGKDFIDTIQKNTPDKKGNNG